MVAIVTPENAPRLKPPGSMATGGEFAEHFFPLQDPEIFFWGQYLAVVVADTPERAEDAAGMVRPDYEPAPFEVDMENHPSQVYEPATVFGTQKLQLKRGDFDAGRAEGAVEVAETYRTPYLNHNPMEPHATVADWTDDLLTLYEPTQWVMGLRSVVSKSFDLKPEKVHIVSPFVGGGFGSKGFSWPHSLAAAMASREAGETRPDKGAALHERRPQGPDATGTCPFGKKRRDPDRRRARDVHADIDEGNPRRILRPGDVHALQVPEPPGLAPGCPPQHRHPMPDAGSRRGSRDIRDRVGDG